ncbi:MAG: PAS domain-containing protein [Leptolyngbya sp. Prado105]|jgi:hypothetical protein|nr:PAS domain-containing protein [Leptolyngbya sp. Prado105]
MLTHLSHTVLIVDDADHDREAYRRYLVAERDLTYQILEEESAESALSLWHTRKQADCSEIDVILLDYRLPDKDGLEFLTELRGDAGEKCPPVILITGQGSETIAVQAFKQGVADYLVKGDITPEGLRYTTRMAIENARLRRKLRESEERYRTVVEDQTELICRFLLDGTLTFVNGAYCRYFNTSSSALIGCAFFDHIPDSALESIQQQLADFLQLSPEHPVIVHEHPVLKPDGELRWLQWTNRAIFDVEGQIIELQAVGRDVSSCRQMSRELQESQRFLQQVADTTPGILYVYDLEQQCNVFVNRRIAELLGYTAAHIQAIGEALISTLIHPDDLARIPAHLAQFEPAPNGTVFELEYRMQHANGEWRWFHSRETVFDRTSEGRVKQILGIVEDVTPRKSAELALSLANERFNLMTSAVNGLVYDYDLQRNHVVRSAGLTELFGYSIEEAEPTSTWWWNLIHPEDRAAFDLKEMRQQMMARSRISGEYRVRHKDGHYIWVEERSFVLLDDAGQPARMVGCTTDITKRKQFEFEREQLLAQTQAAKEESERANQSKDEFLAIVSHELRSPLNAILGWAGVLQSKQLSPEKVQQALATIERNARSQNQLIEDLLDVSRMIRGDLRLTMTSVNLIHVVEMTLQNVQLMAEAKQITLCSSIDLSLDLIVGDENRLRQVVTNLLTNAIKFTPNGGRVEIEVSSTNAMAQIVVRDTGKGIEADFLPYVFDRFRSGARSKEGLGLGLAISRHLVERHGGVITAESSGVGQGATFTVRLPFHQPRSNGSNALAGIKILVVDNEPNALVFLQLALETVAAEVTIASSAQQAIELFQQIQPDFVVSDIEMPEQDGYQLVQNLHRFRSDFVAIALTADTKGKDRALEAGFQVHLVKPINPAELICSIVQFVQLHSH